MGTLANTEDQDEMQHNAAFHQGLHCLLRLKQPSGPGIHHNFEKSACDPLKFTMGIPIPIATMCMDNLSEYKVLRTTSHHKDPTLYPTHNGSRKKTANQQQQNNHLRRNLLHITFTTHH